MREQRETSGSVSYLPALASCALSSKIPQLSPSFPSVLTPPAAWRSPLPGKSLLNFWDLAQAAGISAIFLIPTVALAYFVLFPSPRVPFADSYEAHAVFCGRFLFTCLLHPLYQQCQSFDKYWKNTKNPALWWVWGYLTGAVTAFSKQRVQSGDICQRNNWRIN